jgi:hypothetical protein
MKFLKLAFALLMAQTAHAGSYSHRLHYFGQLSTIEACRSELAEIARGFATAAGVEVLGADCVKSEYYSGGIDGEILYIAPSRVTVTSSDVRDVMRFDGYYHSVAECQAGAQREDVILREKTGLTPFVAYCYRTSSIGAPVYRSRIEAVGISDTKKFSTFSDYFDSPLDAEALLLASRTVAENLGVSLVESAIVRDNSGWHIAMDYYASAKFYIHADEELSFQSEAECLEAAVDAQNSWTAENLPMKFVCTKNGRNFGLNHIWFSPQLFSEGDFSAKILPIAFASNLACLEQKSATVEKLINAGSKIVGSACGLNQAQPRLLVFEVKEARVP